MGMHIISKKTRGQRDRRHERWQRPSESYTIFVHAYQMPNGYVADVETKTKTPRWVAMTLNAIYGPDHPGRWSPEVFETKRQALDHIEAYYTRHSQREGWSLVSAQIAPTVVVRKRKVQTSPVAFELATPENVEA
jgi:hypothetical protein